jgi:23S rRNA pseudouridine2605 synthase
LTNREPTPSRSPPPSRSSARPERLQKLLAGAGLGSRREIEGWIAAGRIAVNGRVAGLGERALPEDRIELDGNPVAIAAPAAVRVIVYHKPEGELVTQRDPAGRATVFERFPKLRGAKWIAVGRLDLNSSGLLLLTSSGELANRLMHPRHGVEREYAVRALGTLSEDSRRALLSGIGLEDGMARFERLEPTGKAEGANRWYRVVLREGRNREVRRMFEAVGLRVSRLMRTRYGPIRLPRALKPGRWVELSPQDVVRLGESC